MAIGIHFFVRRGRLLGVDEDTLYNFALLAILGGVIGARLVYVLTNWGYFTQHPASIVAIWQGGLAIHGALLGGMAASLWYARRHRLPYWALLDGMVPGACIGIFLVRIGNIFNHEILGHPAGILGGARQPAQPFEMLMALALWFIYWRQVRLDRADGVPFFSFALVYSILRFCSEMLRDNPQYLIHYTNHYLGIGFATLEQLFTPLILAFVIWGLRWRVGTNRHSFTVGPRWIPALAGAGGASPPDAGSPASGEDLSPADAGHARS
jgi:phosphatidylglycerol:prolipoprotein diacylglycerol transferase